MTKNDEQITKLWQLYEEGVAYQKSSGLSKKVPVCVKFYEGEQWAPPTEKTKNLPRPVLNIVKTICRTKRSAILSTPVKLVYSTDDTGIDAQKFTDFAAYIQKEINQDSLDKVAIKDGSIKGSYFYHYFWDKEARGKDGNKDGGLRCDIIDVLDIFFANPLEQDEQKQKWILISTREDVDAVKSKCDKNIDKEFILADDKSENSYGEKEQDNSNLCTVLTRYFRINGEVYCEKATKTTIINKPFSIAPDIEGAIKLLNLEDDAPNNSLPDKESSKNLQPDTIKAPLYPIVVGNYEKKEKSIYGMGEVENIIPNQKSINFNIAMHLLNIENMAWGKYIVAPNALKGQTISNEPGQVIIDYSGSQQGIKKLTDQPISSSPMAAADTLMQLTRVVTGSTEIMTGEVLGANMSGAAIAQLQSQAMQPIQDLKETFWQVKEKQGKVLAQFFKLFYESKEFTMPKEDSLEQESSMPQTFNGSEYQNVNFEVVVEATAGTKASAAGDINVLDTLLSKGLISLKTYFKCYPKDALSNRTELINNIEEDEQSQFSQLKQQFELQSKQLLEATKLLQQQKETVDKVVSVIKENNQLRTVIANLYSEARQKIELGNSKINETTKDATDFALMITDLMRKQGGIEDVMPQM